MQPSLLKTPWLSALLSACLLSTSVHAISIIGVGDIMLGANYPSSDYLPPDEGKHLLSSVSPILRGADLTFGNLEGTILNSGGQAKQCGDPSKCYVFRTPEKYALQLKTTGFDLLSVANNHAGDFGDTGRKSTLAFLKQQGIQAAGQSIQPTAVFSKEGIKYGFAAFAPNMGTVDLRDVKKAQQIVRGLAQQSDIVIVSFHGGAEGAQHQHVTRKSEQFYGENRGNVYEFAHAVIDAGADLVFGHGPHVTRALELYKNRFIAYSLGNFCTYGRFNLKGANGIAPIIKVEIDKQGNFSSAEVTSTQQLGKGGTSLDPKNRAFETLRQLTQADFPETPLVFGKNGLISPK